jgi:hypothetical protein
VWRQDRLRHKAPKYRQLALHGIRAQLFGLEAWNQGQERMEKNISCGEVRDAEEGFIKRCVL